MNQNLATTKGRHLRHRRTKSTNISSHHCLILNNQSTGVYSQEALEFVNSMDLGHGHEKILGMKKTMRGTTKEYKKKSSEVSMDVITERYHKIMKSKR